MENLSESRENILYPVESDGTQTDSDTAIRMTRRRSRIDPREKGPSTFALVYRNSRFRCAGSHTRSLYTLSLRRSLILERQTLVKSASPRDVECCKGNKNESRMGGGRTIY